MLSRRAEAPSIDLRDYPHPESLLGTWVGRFQPADGLGDIDVELELGGTGRIHYQESGAHEAVCKGLWGYKNHLFVFRFDQIKEADANPFWQPHRNRLIAWDVLKCDDTHLVLQFNPGETCTLTRQPRRP
jgi:hypothetical protein